MSTTVGSQKVISKETKSTTRNGITETVVTEVIQLPDGTVKTFRQTTTTGTTTHSSNFHTIDQREISQKTAIKFNENADIRDENRSNKLTSSFSKLLRIKGHDNKDKIKSTNSNKDSSPKIRRASSSSDSDSSDDDNDFAETCLKWHNNYRALHGVPPLTLSKTLNKYAEEWAKKLAAEDSFRHRSDHKYGENIFMQWSSSSSFKIKGNAPVESWYSEIKDHTFGIDRPGSGSGHFTQVIWKESKQLGVGKARSKSGKILVVCNYDPPGNLLGTYASNVPPKCK